MTGRGVRDLRFMQMLAALIMLLVLQSLIAVPQALAQRTFTPRFGTNANGDIRLIGNTVKTCNPAGLNGGTCVAARAATAAVNDNGSYNTQNVDVDGDPTTFNSSQATLAMPAGSTVLFAGLYWGARSVAAARNQVLLRTPATGGYTAITASTLDIGVSGAASNYAAFANITAQVAAAGNGNYTLANIQADDGNDVNGFWGGWSLVVVYNNAADSLKNLVVYDGYAQITAGGSVTVTPSGFLTPLSGPVNARIGSVVYDGDTGPGAFALNEQVTVNGTALSNAANPANDYLNSTISDLGALVTTRSPNDRNTFGLDVDRTNVPSGVIPNGATSATVVMSSPGAGESFYPHVLTTAIDLYVPIITPNVVKSVADINGGGLVPGDALRWTISLTNTGIDTGTNVILKDPIPPNTTYVPNSLNIIGGANAGIKTDGASDDQAEFSASAVACAPVTAPCAIFRLGAGANASVGGGIPFGASTSLSFDTAVNAGVASGTQISNTASISYSGQTLGSTFSTTSAAASITVLGAPQITKSFSANPIAVNGTSVLTIVVSNPASSPLPMNGVTFSDTYPAGLVNTASPSAAVSCTVGSTPGTLTGGAASGNAIGMNPGATLAPGGSCNITVNVTSATAGSYLNTTSAVTSTNAGTGSAASATLAVGTPGISKLFAPASIVAGGTSVITFAINNPAGVALTGVGFTDTLTNMQVAGTPAVSNSCGGTVSATAGATGANAITLSGGTLPANGSCTVTVTVTSSSAGIQPNTTSGVTSSAPTGLPSNTANLTVIGVPVATKSFSPTSIQSLPVNATAKSTLTIVISNPNTTTTVTGVALTDNYPQNVGGVAAADMLNAVTPNATLNCTTGSSATLTGGAASGTSIGITGGTLAPGGSCTISVSVTGGAAANYVNSTGAITTTNAGTGAAANATLNVTNLTPPTVAKSFAVANIALGTTTTMTITLTNPQATPITGVAFTDTYPSGLLNSNTPGAATTCTGGVATAAANGSSLSLSGATIPASASCTVTVTVTSSTRSAMLNSIPAGGVTTANAGVNTAVASATLRAVAPPTITKTFSPDAIGIDAADFSTMTMVVANPVGNPVTLTGVGFTDAYPQDVGGNAAADMVNATTPASTNVCTAGSTAGVLGGNAAGNTTLTLTNATVAAGGSCTITIRVRGGAAASYTNTTGNVAATGPIALTGNQASAVLSVGRPGITKSFATSPIVVGGTSVMNILLRNDTAVAMTAAAFTDTYPATMTNAAAPAASTTCGGTVTAAANGPSVALAGGTIPANSTCTVSVTVTATATAINSIAAGALTTSAGSNATAATATLVVIPPLGMAKSFTPSSIEAGGTSVLSITLTNSNNFAVTGVNFTDNYPSLPGVMRNTATPAGATTCAAGTVTAAANGTSLVFAGGNVPANSSCQITVNVTAPTTGSYVNSTLAGTSTNGGVVPIVSGTLNVVSPPSITKLVTVISDPVNGTTNPKAIPGAIVEYNLLVTNSSVALTADSVVISDIFNANTALVVNNIAGVGSGPVAFAQGTVASGLTYSYAGSASATDDLEFFNSGGTRLTALTPNASGCDANVARIQVNPKGVFASGVGLSPQPSFVLRFRVCVK